ncbi:hypothetical protein Ahy_A08g038463 isoform C [Arachis hypogaea]|uniref:Isoamylase 1-3-like C-terminal domain-containing protein n=1 Tax=Arachis hypogaea TaxID=3818 RepID=A0A445BTJ3_ARAHY|nr:hypothetical protein Ahy_A08g038463 isoform C [Arachis hypogaea]
MGFSDSICNSGFQGTPMMLMGDEYGHTRYGNNNSYGHDSSINNFLWDQAKYRHAHKVFSHENFLSKTDITWHEHNWDNYESKFLAFTLHDNSGGDIYLAFNAHDFFVEVMLPTPPTKRSWFRVVDTNLVSPDDFNLDGLPCKGNTYNIAPYSSILLEAKFSLENPPLTIVQ